MISRLFSSLIFAGRNTNIIPSAGATLTLLLGLWIALLPINPASARSSTPASLCWPNPIGTEYTNPGYCSTPGTFNWIPATANGLPSIDYEQGNSWSDPTAGTGGIGASHGDISSGFNTATNTPAPDNTRCNPNVSPPANANEDGNCGEEYSGFWSCANVLDDCDAVDKSTCPSRKRLFFRLRLNGDPSNGGIPDVIGTNKPDLKGGHWNYLISSKPSTSGEDFKEFWVDVDGGFNSGTRPDWIRIIYEDGELSGEGNGVSNQSGANCTGTDCWETNMGTIGDDDGNGTGTVVNAFVACKLQGLAACIVNGTNSTVEYSHTRVLQVPLAGPGAGADPGEYWLDIQIPLKEDKGGTLYDVFTQNKSASYALISKNLWPGLDAVAAYGVPVIDDCDLVSGPTGPLVEPGLKFAYATSDSGTDPVQKDFMNIPEFPGDFTLASVAYFRALRTGTGIRFEWQTSAELANAGFDIYEDTGRGWHKVNSSLIPGAVDSVLPQDYSYEANGTTAARFRLVDIDLKGREHRHGPYDVDIAYGERLETEFIDWSVIQSEHDAKKKTRISKRQDTLRGRSQQTKSGTNQIESTGGSGTTLTATTSVAVGPEPLLNVSVDQDGIQRIGYGDLVAAGLDLAAVPAAEIALTYRGVPVPARVVTTGGDLFGAGSYIEFIGQANNSRYTGTRVYQLHLDPSRAQRVAVDENPVAKKAKVVTEYTETATVDNNLWYNFTSPNSEDPWAETMLIAPTSRPFTINIDNLVPRTSATLHLNVWGTNDLPADPDHHLLVELNGTAIADETFDGNVDVSLDIPVHQRYIQDGENTVTLQLPFDLQGVPYEFIRVNTYGLSYTRSLVARDGALSFTADGSAFQVDGLGSNNVVAYRTSGDSVTFISNTSVANGTATLGGTGSESQYYVSAVSSVHTPNVEAAIVHEDILSGDAEYLVIAHPDFAESADLNSLVESRLSDRFASAKIVDVDQIYAQFAGGNLDPEAIHQYITHAIENMSTQAVLIVGGDTYDYRNYLGLGAVHFIPTLFTDVGDGFKHTPVEAQYADIDGDNVPDAGIGRLPARTSEQLSTLVNKTLAFSSPGRTLVFAADDATTGGSDFSSISDTIASAVSEDDGWSIQRIYLDDLGASAAHSQLLDAFKFGNAGLVSYVGHSNGEVWTGNSPRLLSMSDAQAINNPNGPSVVAQWGCWMDHLNPYYETLAHKLLLNPNGGAVATFGMAGASSASADATLAPLAQAAMLQPQAMLGVALTDAKQQLAPNAAQFLDVILGGTLLGDPALMINP